MVKVYYSPLPLPNILHQHRQAQAGFPHRHHVVRPRAVGRERQPLLGGKAALHGEGDVQAVALRFHAHRPLRVGQRAGVAAGRDLPHRPFAGARGLAALMDHLCEVQHAAVHAAAPFHQRILGARERLFQPPLALKIAGEERQRIEARRGGGGDRRGDRRGRGHAAPQRQCKHRREGPAGHGGQSCAGT